MSPVPSQPTRPRAPRSLPFGMPPRGWLLAGWALLPVRAFLAVTFLFAGLQKLANPAFFNNASATSLHQQMIGYILSRSPLTPLLDHLLRWSTPLAVFIALSEIAIGLGLALGLWTRAAAVGGMLLTFSLFLTASWHAHPWYTGADLVYFFMLTPFVVAGAGGVLSLDAAIARRAASEGHLEDVQIVLLPFAEAQQSCGAYADGDCRAIANRRCAPNGCPFLEGVRGSLAGGREFDQVDRRAVVLGGVAAAAAATAGLIAAGSAAGAGAIIGNVKVGPGAKTLPPTSTGPTGASGATGSAGADETKIGPATDVPTGQSAYFTVPGGSGDPGIVIHEPSGQFVAYNAVCPHAGCTVGYSSANNVIACPCHGSEFQVSTGDVIVGPATVGLTALSITDKDGALYVE